MTCLATGLLFNAGCGKDKNRILVPHPDPGPGPVYPALATPEIVLSTMAQAYMARDTVEIKLLYDDDYQGSSVDQLDPGPGTLTFTKADEVGHVAGLANDPSIANIIVSLHPGITRFSDAGDPPSWATIQNPITSLEIEGGPSSLTVDIPRISMEFKFIPTTPDSTSPNDTTWKIIRWTEVRN